MNMKKFVEECKGIAIDYENANMKDSLDEMSKCYARISKFKNQIYAEVKVYKDTHCKEDISEIEYYENLAKEDKLFKQLKKSGEIYEV